MLEKIFDRHNLVQSSSNFYCLRNCGVQTKYWCFYFNITITKEVIASWISRRSCPLWTVRWTPWCTWTHWLTKCRQIITKIAQSVFAGKSFQNSIPMRIWPVTTTRSSRTRWSAQMILLTKPSPKLAEAHIANLSIVSEQAKFFSASQLRVIRELWWTECPDLDNCVHVHNSPLCIMDSSRQNELFTIANKTQ